MRLRLVHSCMVLGVLALLFCYSAFLSAPPFSNDESGFSDGRRGNDLDSFMSAPPQPLQQISEANTLGEQSSSSSSQPHQALPAVSSGEPLEVSSQRVIEKEQKRDVGAMSLPSQPQAPPTETQKVVVPTQKSSGFAFPLTRDVYESGFSYPNPSLCPNDGEDVRLFIMIMSAPSHFTARDAIRLTWAHYAQRSDISIAFLIGRTNNETILEGMEMEKHLYDDLIVANFADSYDNLTLKTIATLEWAENFCNQSQFLLKTDDDMFINVPNLLHFMARIEVDDAKEGKIYGRLAKKWKPVRNKKSKYYITFQQYKKTVYPDFTTGPAYLFPTRLASKLFAKGLERTYLKLEDVYTTGIIAQELGIKRVNVQDFANKKVNFHKTGYCALSRLISMHMVAFHEQFDLWKKLLDGRTKCKVVQSKKETVKEVVKKEAAGSGGGGATVKTIPAS